MKNHSKLTPTHQEVMFLYGVNNKPYRKFVRPKICKNALKKVFTCWALLVQLWTVMSARPRARLTLTKFPDAGKTLWHVSGRYLQYVLQPPAADPGDAGSDVVTQRRPRATSPRLPPWKIYNHPLYKIITIRTAEILPYRLSVELFFLRSPRARQRRSPILPKTNSNSRGI